jgi:hypothetical protein
MTCYSSFVQLTLHKLGFARRGFQVAAIFIPIQFCQMRHFVLCIGSFCIRKKNIDGFRTDIYTFSNGVCVLEILDIINTEWLAPGIVVVVVVVAAAAAVVVAVVAAAAAVHRSDGFLDGL